MKPPRHLTLFVFCLISLVALSTRAEDTPRAPKPEMKGMELYSWRDPQTHQWTYSLLIGTNSLKPDARIMDPKTAIKTTADLKARLAALAVGEYVTWNAHDTPKTFSFPEKEVVDQIKSFSKSKQLQLHLAGE